MTIRADAYDALEAIVGPENISADPVTCQAYRAKSYRTETAYRLICTTPACVVLPRTTEEVQRTVRVCNRYRIPYTPVSTYWLANSAPKRHDELLIDLKRMNRLTIDDRHMYAIVEPGVIYGQLQQAAMDHGLYTMVSGGGSQVSVVCNHINHGWSPLNYRTGLIGRRILGVEWVLPDGELLKLGSLAADGEDFSWGEGIGPDLRGILRGATGWKGGLGIVTRLATKLLPFIPEKLEPSGISPDTSLLFPPRIKWYNFSLPSREALERAMYELGWHEIAAAATKVPVMWRYIARAKSKEDFWRLWGELTPEEVAGTHILRVLVIGYTSEAQLEYEERVLTDIMTRLGGELRRTRQSDESWLKNADSAGMWWMSGAYCSVEYDVETIQHGVKQGEAIAELKKRFVPPLLDDFGDPGWFQTQEMGHCDYSEYLTYWDPYDAERYKADQMYLETVKQNIAMGFFTSFLGPAQPIWLTGPAYGPDYHLWQLRVKKVFDPGDLSNPPALESYDEVVEKAPWLKRDWPKGDISRVE